MGGALGSERRRRGGGQLSCIDKECKFKKGRRGKVLRPEFKKFNNFFKKIIIDYFLKWHF